MIHLRNHTHYSLLKALPQIKQVVKKAKELGMTHLAITDYDNMYGAIEFYNECLKQEIKPIIGVELSIKSDDSPNSKIYKLPILAKNLSGYHALLRLVSEANLFDAHAPHLTKDLLKKYLRELEYVDGLIALSGGIDGEMADALAITDFTKAEKIYLEYQEIFSQDNVYIEIENHFARDRAKEVRENTVTFVKEYLKDTSKLIASCNPHYLREEDKSAHKVLFSIHGEEDDINLYNIKFKTEDYSFLSNEQAEKAFKDIKDEHGIDAVANTQTVADKTDLKLELGKWYFPDIAKDYKEEIDTGKTIDDIVRRLAIEGIEKRKIPESRHAEVIERLDYELNIIKTKGYAPYFLVVYDLLKYASDHGILTNIRGSVAGSMATYLLRITKCDPLVYQIPFERFLNPERPSAPDIDMDYADNRRDEVIDYVRRKFGEKNVAQIGTFGTMLARGAVKDVARAMKYPYTLGDKISKMIPMPKQGFPVYVDTALAEVEELKEMYNNEREVQIILDMAKKVEGLVRHIGVHAAGVVIAPRPVYEFSPIQYDPKGEGKIITQYDMYSVDENNAGLLKFDFLGIRNLTILKTAISLARERYNVDIDIEEIDLEDKKTFEMLSLGYTVGLFQLNGSGMTKFLKELKPTSIYDINAMVALYRPGPIANIPVYIERKHNPKLVSYLYDDERLKNILEKTFGVLVYQDDLLMMSIELAGYTWGEADKFRKAVGKKIPEEMQKQKEKFITGCVGHGKWPKVKAEELWAWIEPFAAYGFNKAHSASYGRVAYQTAFMKANYPIAFMTAILTEESGDIDKISEIVAECKRMKITVLPPDVNYSFGGFKIVDEKEDKKYSEAIRFGLYTIKNLGANIADAIIGEREKNGKYKSLEDFMNRITHKDLNKKSLESLIMCGAMDAFGERGQMLYNVDHLLEYHKTHIKDQKDQTDLFSAMFENQDSSRDSQSSKFTLQSAPAATVDEKLTWEKELLGLYISGSPLDRWKDKIEKRNVNIKNILDDANEEVKDNKPVTLPCLIEKVKVTKTKQGDQMALLKVADYTGRFEVAVFPKTYKNIKSKIVLDTPVLLSGKAASKNGEKTMVLEDIKVLS